MLSEAHLLLTPDNEHRKVFGSVPVIGFKRAKSLKDILVRAKLPPIHQDQGGCKICNQDNCDVCFNVKETSTFSDVKGRLHRIKANLDCNSKFVVYLLTCACCGLKYVGSTNSFRERFNNYSSCQARHRKQKVPQQKLHEHFSFSGYHGFANFEFTLINQGFNLLNIGKREKFWQYELNTFSPNGLNDREVSVK